ncbi:MAG: response regulator [Bacteroidetes bacterium]|jgi:adenylate cyclase|nr:response regulator [Bacteroidota bacterium]MCO5278752.1 response regulator [Saprospiraceae bacterium]HMT76195.1 adenylate/guanylate cyclase domain-containing protein [Saprospiraceae bacterium]HQU95529.1 adenylate/guanylate cyclase domain-containing protein [Saprospiraceae bacterium]HRG42897.1 adenylate/guanylate cyclase domain-containing protein [Saprospiraceae bacterium]
MITKILVVDDEKDLELLIRQRFRQKIRDQHYEFFFAQNGRLALDELEKTPDINVVLTDLNMPEMDGITLLTKLSERNYLLKSVVISAYGDLENIRSAMNHGAFDFLTKPVDFKDLDVTVEKTIQQVDQMKATMKAIQENNILKMYVDETVLNFMSGHEFETMILKNELIEATVVFIDICSFTRFSEKESPDTVVKLLNTYFDVMVNEIILQGGHIDKFLGDAVMAVFSGEFHLDRAIDASLAVRNKINHLTPDESHNSFTPKVSIGINSGEMISGNIGSGKLKRLDFTVIGDVVNTAQRLQSVAKENQIIINEDSYNRIKMSFHCNKVGDVELKNKENKMKIYEVIS